MEERVAAFLVDAQEDKPINTLAKGVEKAVAEKGFLGAFTGGLTASAGGIAAPQLFGYNKKAHFMHFLLYIPLSAALAWVCTLF